MLAALPQLVAPIYPASRPDAPGGDTLAPRWLQSAPRSFAPNCGFLAQGSQSTQVPPLGLGLSLSQDWGCGHGREQKRGENKNPQDTF